MGLAMKLQEFQKQADKMKANCKSLMLININIKYYWIKFRVVDFSFNFDSVCYEHVLDAHSAGKYVTLPHVPAVHITQ